MDEQPQPEPQTVSDLLDLIAAGDENAREQLLAHMASLAERSRCDGYKQAKRDLLLAVTDLEPTA
jgi:hypothetical protein